MPEDNCDQSSVDIIKMFRHSIAPYSKKLVALHPHLYGNLYRRASEIQALDKILHHLKAVEEETKGGKYHSLPYLLSSIKDALHGKPPLSWWNLFTATLGYAFSRGGYKAKNDEEYQYLSSISEILTKIIRTFHSSNTKLLLEIRLTALEVDARLIELEKIPEGVQEVNQTLEYLISEFSLLIEEQKKSFALPKESYNQNLQTFLDFIKRTNSLMKIAYNVKQTDIATYNKFSELHQSIELKKNLIFLFKNYTWENIENELHSWQQNELDNFFEVFNYFPDVFMLIPPSGLYAIIYHQETTFIANPHLDKVRPSIFFSSLLKKYLGNYSESFKERFEQVGLVVKGAASDPNFKIDPVNYFKNLFSSENDLYNLCTLAHSKKNEIIAFPYNPQAIQTDILNRLVRFANLSQPKILDEVIKNFTEKERETRYFLAQEVILEQFIRWRKQGIY